MDSIRPHISLRALALASLAIGLALVLWFLSVPSATGDSSRALTPDQKSHLPGLLGVRSETLTPRLGEIQERLEQERAQLEPLREAYRKATDPQEARKLERKIGEIKSQTEEQVLQIQLKYAQLEGKQKRVETLENLLTPRTVPVMAKSGEAPVRRHQEEEQR